MLIDGWDRLPSSQSSFHSFWVPSGCVFYRFLSIASLRHLWNCSDGFSIRFLTQDNHQIAPRLGRMICLEIKAPHRIESQQHISCQMQLLARKSIVSSRDRGLNIRNVSESGVHSIIIFQCSMNVDLKCSFEDHWTVGDSSFASGMRLDPKAGLGLLNIVLDIF